MSRQKLLYLCAAFSSMLILLQASHCRAQSPGIRKDLLQGFWMFYNLDALVNLDMKARTQTHNPWNINFTIKGDTCTMRRLVALSPDAHYRYDTSMYLIRLEEDQLLFFPVEHPKRKPALTLKIVSLQNQTFTVEDPESAKTDKTLFLRNVTFTYTFARYQSPGQDLHSPQRALQGRWYCDYDFLWSVSHEGDSLKLSADPKPYSMELSAAGAFVDSIYRYKTVDFSEENIRYNDSTDMRSGSDTYVYAAPPRYDDPYEPKPSYFIVPQRKLIEVVVPQKTDKKDRYNFPVYTYNSFLFNYYLHNGTLLLVRKRVQE